MPGATASSRSRASLGPLGTGWNRLRERLRSSLWPIPTAAIVAAVLAGLAVTQLDRLADGSLPSPVAEYLFSGGPDTARSVLSAIAGALITATSLTFSLTVLALQLASSQASPRLLRVFASDALVHWTLATFLGTFAFALTVLRTIRSSTEDDPGFVPRMAVTISFGLALLSVVMLVLFLAHLARELRVETMLVRVHRETDHTIAQVRQAVESQRSADPPSPVGDAHLVLSRSSGFLTGSRREQLIRTAARQDLVVREEIGVGDITTAGTPILRWWPRHAGNEAPGEKAEVDRELLDALSIDDERTPAEDIGFGIRQLVDIASRALSPGVNDPTTAAHAIGHLADLLLEVARLPAQPEALADDEGVARLLPHRHDPVALLEDAITEPRRYGSDNPIIVGRLFALLRDLAYGSDDVRLHLAIRREADRLLERAQGQDFDDVERERLTRQRADVEVALAGRWPG